jgi:phospholipase C
VIFQENVSFDHYFGTYPRAANTSGQPFVAAPGSPSVNGLTRIAAHREPERRQPAPLRPDQRQRRSHLRPGPQLSDEQKAFDGGAMDKFPQSVGTDDGTKSPEGNLCVADDVMNYYDGNTVTALWNYAQRYGMGDNYFGTNFDPSAPGAINLASGDTGGVDMTHTANNP